ncbi:immunoglobulin lambda-1 light chain-like isoform X2 [Myxocyprinus asiaticus]|uniref:immunoglobulin lambda-1 light chain-like isoform X2 n=1 Tax=Myxocyprinus asiaticus TaxID=70543 RepID=UPI002222782F|nr:immunoglobulin lambda-1 light chain-like isoform X2 [Myxocyprinus asiaticus]
MHINMFAVVILMIHGVEGLTLNQPQKVLVKQTGKTVSFKCEVNGLGNDNYVHWYQKKDGETFKRLLYISASGKVSGEAKDFVGEKNGNSYDIKLKGIKDEHAGVYYCACWDGSNKKVFGSGTRLYVTKPGKDKAVAPEVSVYPLSVAQPNGKSTMLCQATKMFPDLVKFSWEMKGKTGGDWTEVEKENVVEQRNERPTIVVTSMVIVDKNTAKNNHYRCTVTHEGTNKIIELRKEPAVNTNVDTGIPATCPPPTDTLDQTPSLYLFVYAYGVTLMKNGVYFCAVSIILLKRKAGKKDASS